MTGMLRSLSVFLVLLYNALLKLYSGPRVHYLSGIYKFQEFLLYIKHTFSLVRIKTSSHCKFKAVSIKDLYANCSSLYTRRGSRGVKPTA